LPRFDLARPWGSLLIHFYILLGAIGVSEPTLLKAGTLLLFTMGWPFAVVVKKVSLAGIQATTRIAVPLALVVAVIFWRCELLQYQGLHASFLPVPPGYFMPDDEWNGEIIHFLSRTGSSTS